MNLNIASLDIKGAYDGIDHHYLLEQVKKWKKLGFFSEYILDLIIFLFS